MARAGAGQFARELNRAPEKREAETEDGAVNGINFIIARSQFDMLSGLIIIKPTPAPQKHAPAIMEKKP